MVVPNAGSRRGSKGKNAHNLIILKLSSSSLAKFPIEQSSSHTSTPGLQHSPSIGAPDIKDENGSKANTPPADAGLATPQPDAAESQARRGKGAGGRGGSNAAGGLKRSNSVLDETQPKPRNKPGPKRRKVDGLDENGKPLLGPNSLPPHKINPKANQGAINANLRALDRSGKPCRAWNRTSFKVKSFTGIVWEVPAWGTPKRPSENGTQGELNGQTGDGDGEGAEAEGEGEGEDEGEDKENDRENNDGGDVKVNGKGTVRKRKAKDGSSDRRGKKHKIAETAVEASPAQDDRGSHASSGDESKIPPSSPALVATPA